MIGCGLGRKMQEFGGGNGSDAGRREIGIFSKEGGGEFWALTLSLWFSQLAKGEEGGGVAWFYQEELERLARVVDSNPQTWGDCS